MLGPFSVADAAGTDVTPKGAKNQALMALLALSPGMTRPRRWIEDKLWSTFGAEQASANLRQALSKLRGGLGAAADLLQADRSTITLGPEGIWVDLLDGEVPMDPRTELLQGMDIRDPEFEDWLRIERQELQSRIARATPQQAKGVLIHCRSFAEAPGRGRMVGEVLANQIGEGIAEQVRAWRQSTDSTDPAASLPDSDIQIDCQLVRETDGHSVYIKSVHKPSARILYSKLHHLNRLEDVLESEEATAKTIFEATDQIIGKLPQALDTTRPEARATALSRLGMYRMFSFERDGLREAYGLMKQAHDRDENGIYLAWSSLVRMIQLTEMAEREREALRAEAEELHFKAIELSNDNPLVHAILSRVRGIVMKDPEGCYQMAKTAVEANPASAYAWVSMAEALMMAGRPQEALALSARARNIARTSPFKHWWDTGHCVIAIACNRPQDAIEAGEAAARAAPLSRPAHRHLLALYALEGQLDKARAIATKLGKIEPGFSLDRLVNDETYPVRTLRKKGLLEPIRALL
ncbi:transcriptional regulator [Pseudoponticoccus marisrubri]|nr:transcriptional regulator [Pseudoponticoccus marisrubri]